MMQFGAGDSVQTLFVPSETEFAAHLLASGLELQRPCIRVGPTTTSFTECTRICSSSPSGALNTKEISSPFAFPCSIKNC